MLFSDYLESPQISNQNFNMCKKFSLDYPQFQSAANSELKIAHCSSREGTDESHQLNVTKKDSECFKHFSCNATF